MSLFETISVTAGKDNKPEVLNPTTYPLIGYGTQAAIFQLSPDRCVKIFVEPINAEREKNALAAAESSPFIPKMYEAGPNYIIMDYIKGLSLKEYIQSQGGLPGNVTLQILQIFKEMKRLNFTMLDMRIKDIIVTEQGLLKVVDHVDAFRIKRSRPINLFKDLTKLNLLDSFLEQLKKIDPEAYEQWTLPSLTEQLQERDDLDKYKIQIVQQIGDVVRAASGEIVRDVREAAKEAAREAATEVAREVAKEAASEAVRKTIKEVVKEMYSEVAQDMPKEFSAKAPENPKKGKSQKKEWWKFGKKHE